MVDVTDVAYRQLQAVERRDGQIPGGMGAYANWHLASNKSRRMPSPLTCTTDAKCVLLLQRYRKFAVH